MSLCTNPGLVELVGLVRDTQVLIPNDQPLSPSLSVAVPPLRHCYLVESNRALVPTGPKSSPATTIMGRSAFG